MKYKILILFIFIAINIFSESKRCLMKLGENFIVYNDKIFSVENTIDISSFLDELTEKK